MRSLLLAALFGLAGPACADDPKPKATEPTITAAQAAAMQGTEMERVRAVLLKMQTEKHFYAGTADDDADLRRLLPGSDPRVNKHLLPMADDGASGDPIVSSVGAYPPSAIGGSPASIDPNSPYARRLRRAQSNIRINDQLKAMGIDMGSVDVGVGARTVVLGVKF